MIIAVNFPIKATGKKKPETNDSHLQPQFKKLKNK